MFSNVGKELKIWARIFFIAMIIVPVLLGLLLIIDGANNDTTGVILLGIIIAVAGVLMARLSVILLYAFGDLVESTSAINQKLDYQFGVEQVARPSAEYISNNPINYSSMQKNTNTFAATNSTTTANYNPINNSGIQKNVNKSTPTNGTASFSYNPQHIPTWKRTQMEREAKEKAAAQHDSVNMSEWKCAVCGTENLASHRFCYHCGGPRN